MEALAPTYEGVEGFKGRPWWCAPDPEPVKSETCNIVAFVPGGFFGVVPVFAEDIGVEPTTREWYEPIENEL